MATDESPENAKRVSEFCDLIETCETTILKFVHTIGNDSCHKSRPG